MKMNIQINEFAPCELLRPFVEFFWKGRFNKDSDGTLRQQVVPNGYVELVIHLSDLHCDLYKNGEWSQSPDYTVIGMHTQRYEVHFGSEVSVFGIRFKPEGFQDIFGVPAAAFGNTFDDMSHVSGKVFREFCEKIRSMTNLHAMLQLSELFLLKQLARHRLQDNYVGRAAELIRQSRGFIRIDELSKKVFVSERQLERMFRQKLGVSPKYYIRMARLNEVHRLFESGFSLNLTQLSYECGYADQAHFIRDFSAFMGIRPKFFVKNRADFIVNPNLAQPPN
jgi:AraC-like DNA-binding protein